MTDAAIIKPKVSAPYRRRTTVAAVKLRRKTIEYSPLPTYITRSLVTLDM